MWYQSHWANIKVLVAIFLSEYSREDLLSCSFELLVELISMQLWKWAPFSCWQSSESCLYLPATSSQSVCTVSTSLKQQWGLWILLILHRSDAAQKDLFFFFFQDSWLDWITPDNQGKSPDLKVLPVITLRRSFFLFELTYLQMPGIKAWTSLEDHSSACHSLLSDPQNCNNLKYISQSKVT